MMNLLICLDRYNQDIPIFEICLLVLGISDIRKYNTREICQALICAEQFLLLWMYSALPNIFYKSRVRTNINCYPSILHSLFVSSQKPSNFPITTYYVCLDVHLLHTKFYTNRLLFYRFHLRSLKMILMVPIPPLYTSCNQDINFAYFLYSIILSLLISPCLYISEIIHSHPRSHPLLNSLKFGV